MNVYYDRDADPGRLGGRVIAVMGYGSQGSAQAQNLRDSGCQVVVGLRPGSPSEARARRAGFAVLPTPEAVARAQVAMLLVPDEQAPAIFRQEVAPHLAPGAYLGFSHGFGIHFGLIQPAAGVNVFLVAPKSPGDWVRREYQRGAGVPCLLAVHQDPGGNTRALGLAYAAAIGGGRAGVIETSFREETETDLFGEQAVLCGGASALIQAGYETLVEAGYAPEMAYFECLHEMKLIVDLLYRGGLSAMRREVSNTARYGDLTRGPRLLAEPVKARMRALLAEIQSGAFAAEWMAEHEAGGAHFAALSEQARQHPMEAVGERLRAMMPWLQGQGEAAPRAVPAGKPVRPIPRLPGTTAAAAPAGADPRWVR
ncbi:MAG TPA: ketol-acid reductoisomerase [Terriglobales bacterium]|nr:ketol-acid reductoisomerase [Terriglobales bacterium]